MRKYFSVLFLCLSCCLLSSCGNDDEINDLNERVDGLTQRVEVLENWRNETNTNIQSLQALVQSLQNNDMITSVVPVKNGNEVIGYTISFLKSAPITIYHGEDGKDGADGKDGEDGKDGANGATGATGTDGYTPQIGVKQDTDGIYYWTLDGEWLLDEAGAKVKAQGEAGAQGNPGAEGTPGTPGTPGENGNDGLTPELMIGEDGYWYVSYDGEEWIQLGDKPAYAGSDIFTEVKIEETHITFVLSDGTELVVPTNVMVEITFGEANKDLLSGIAANEVIYIPYTLTNATENTLVTASSDGHYKVMVEPKDQNSGQIVVTAPNEYVDGFVNVHVDTGNGFTSIHVINFYHQEMIFSKGQEYMVAAEGQTIQVPVKMNFNYSVAIPQGDKWVSVADSRSAEFRDETLTFTFETNPNKAARTSKVGIIAENAKEPLYYITFNQASAYFSIDKTHFAVAGEGETLTIKMTSTVGLDVKDVASWITSWKLDEKGTSYTLTLNVPANDTNDYRKNTIKLYEDAAYGGSLLGEIELIQISQTDDAQKNMVFEVSANVANDYTVTLPLDYYYSNKYYDIDCYVDWGDGTKDYVTSKNNRSDYKQPSHTYTGLTGAKTFTVKVSGTVPELTSSNLSAAQKNGIRAVKQWGQTGLKSMSSAFSGCVNLTSIPADNTMAFLEVTSFYSAFDDCTNLFSDGVPADLFKYAINATNFDYVFYETALTAIPENLFAKTVKATSFSSAFASTGISAIPENLFANCPEVTSFSGTFNNCEALTSIPEKLFANCPEVTSFSSTFSDCDALTTIPEKLFANCPEVMSFSSTFFDCDALTAIPAGIFDNNRKVNTFTQVFYSNGQVTGESPYTVINGKKVHLYERKNYTDEFVTPANFIDAFLSCYQLTDYANIPTEWK